MRIFRLNFESAEPQVAVCERAVGKKNSGLRKVTSANKHVALVAQAKGVAEIKLRT